MNANNQNNINNINNNQIDNNIICYDNYGRMVVNKEVINNNTFITNEGEKGKDVITRLFTELLGSDDMSFCVIDGELCVMQNIYKTSLYRPIPGVDVIWLDVDDVVENCDVMIRGEDVNEYVQDNDAQFALYLIVGDSIDFTSSMQYENRDDETKFGHVLPKMGFDLFEMVLSPSVVNMLLDRYDYTIRNLGPTTGTCADFDFADKGVSLKVVSLRKTMHGDVWFTITDHICDGRYCVEGRRTINEDKFGNRLDDDGEIIVEDDE